MPTIKPDLSEDTTDQSTRRPLIIPVLPNDEIDPILPEPIEAPSESDDSRLPEPPDSIDETPKEPTIYV
ncbi:MAG TPA: hypothetical protein PLD20_03660 [Blastocatellia bacterium]|nr:hypothetical protein [Blastocatellia bacterium]HMV86170.1 hypothetical protein [Blastocatellia bacterium]HMX24402.1 hypothetical protein [Blastocatellia bacterium]HMY74554.1 hypothetical protein [Blastocatellia bacterium]HMZ17000.1 hypothetical protein [Blastocatellia bacterium]